MLKLSADEVTLPALGGLDGWNRGRGAGAGSGVHAVRVMVHNSGDNPGHIRRCYEIRTPTNINPQYGKPNAAKVLRPIHTVSLWNVGVWINSCVLNLRVCARYIHASL